MTIPIYASPEQFMRDRSEYARKGIGRGRSVVVTTYAGGILFVAENNWRTLHKVSEIYDRIGFAAVGRYNEFENLRTAGIRLADVRGYSYDRRDVTGRWLANAYAQTLGSIFSEHQKPFEVELCVAEVGSATDAVGAATSDQLYRISYDGSIVDETRYVVMGGVVDPVATSLESSYTPGWDLGTALRAAVTALGAAGDGAPRVLGAAQVEVAILDRTRSGRTFRRFHDDDVAALLIPPDADPDMVSPDEEPVAEDLTAGRGEEPTDERAAPADEPDGEPGAGDDPGDES